MSFSEITAHTCQITCTGVDPGFVGPEACTISGTPLKYTHTQNYKYKIRYKSEYSYLFRAPPRALEGAHASDGP